MTLLRSSAVALLVACGSAPPPAPPPPAVGGTGRTSDLACATDPHPMRVLGADGTLSITTCSVGPSQLSWSATAGSAAPARIDVNSAAVQFAAVIADASGSDNALVIIEQLDNRKDVVAYRCTGTTWVSLYEHAFANTNGVHTAIEGMHYDNGALAVPTPERGSASQPQPLSQPQAK